MDKNKCNSCGETKCSCKNKDFTKAVIEIDNPEQITLMRKVVIPASMGDDTTVPPAIGKYHNVILHYEANKHTYLYSSDGIPTLLEMDIPQEVLDRIAYLENGLEKEIKDRSDADVSLQENIAAEEQAREDADELLDERLSSAEEILSTTLQPEDIDKTVTTDIALSPASPSAVSIIETKENLLSDAQTTESFPLPIASESQAGIITSVTHNIITESKGKIDALSNGAVAISGLPTPPTQAELTTAWEQETGMTELINRASIYDVTNDKVWTYYSNDETWYAASNTSQVTISQFTNGSAGTIKGSTNDGQVSAEADGTGSVSGWGALKDEVAGKQDELSSANAGNAITIENGVINADIYPADFFTSDGTVDGCGNEVSLDNTIVSPLKDIRINGDTFQHTYTGKNLLPYPYKDGGSKVAKGITFTAAPDGSVTLNGTNDGTGNSAYMLYDNASSPLQFEAGTYYFIPPSNTSVGYVMYDGTTYYDFDSSNNYSRTFPNTKSMRQIYIQVRRNNTTVFNNLKVYPMLTTLPNQTEADYEPYTGSTPSQLSPAPNPDYPQDVQVVTGEQTINIKGRNLLNLSLATGITSQGVTGAIGGDGSLVISGTATGTNPRVIAVTLLDLEAGTYTFSIDHTLGYVLYIHFGLTDGTYQNIRIERNTKSTTATLTSPVRNYDIRLVTTSGASYSDTVYLQIEKGSAATSYEPYQSREYKVNLGKNLFDAGTAETNAWLSGTDGHETTSNDPNIVSGFINVQKGSIYTISGIGDLQFNAWSYDAPTSNTGKTHLLYNSTTTRTIVPDTNYVRISIGGGDAWSIRGQVQFELGETPTDYAPYFTPLELCKIGDYQDHIYKNGSDWYLHKEVRHLSKVVSNMNNTENFPGWTGTQEFSQDFPASTNTSLNDLTDSWDNITGVNMKGSGRRIWGANNISNVLFANRNFFGTTWTQSYWTTNYPNLVVDLYYGIVNTPTDTKITNTTLTAQLNALANSSSLPGLTAFSATAPTEGLAASLCVSAADKSLTTILEEIESSSCGEAEFIFPKFWANQYSQDCSLIKYHGNVICIDCGVASNWGNISAMMSDNGVTHIDYFILSHYHGDHMGNIGNLIDSGFINSNTTVFLPVVPDVEKYADISASETSIKNALDAAAVSYRTPSEKETIYLDADFSIMFGNVDEEYLAETQPNYNSCSMVCLVSYKDTCALYAGDAGAAAYRYLYNTGFVTRTVDIYKQGHHGIDIGGYLLWSESISPRHVVQMSGIMDYRKNNFLSEESSFLIHNGSLYYSTCMQNDYIKFISDGSGVECANGMNFPASGGARISTNIYVDANASSSAIQDGSQEHPFRELMQAITSLQSYPNSIVHIYLADGTYGVGHESTGTGNYKNNIRIALRPEIEVNILGNASDRSKVVLSNVYIYGSWVRFADLTINKDGDDASSTSNSHIGVSAYNSSVRLDNVHVTSLTGSKKDPCLVVSQGSEVHINPSTKLEYGEPYAIRAFHAATLTFSYGATVENCDGFVYNPEGGALTNPISILNTSDDFTATLKHKITDFSALDIQYRHHDGHRQSVRIDTPSVGQTVAISVPYINPSGTVYEDRALLTFTNANTMTLSNKYELILRNGQPVEIRPQSSGGIRVQQVHGYLTPGR